MSLREILEHGTYVWEIFAATWLNDSSGERVWWSYSSISARPGPYTLQIVGRSIIRSSILIAWPDDLPNQTLFQDI